METELVALTEWWAKQLCEPVSHGTRQRFQEELLVQLKPLAHSPCIALCANSALGTSKEIGRTVAEVLKRTTSAALPAKCLARCRPGELYVQVGDAPAIKLI